MSKYVNSLIFFPPITIIMIGIIISVGETRLISIVPYFWTSSLVLINSLTSLSMLSSKDGYAFFGILPAFSLFMAIGSALSVLLVFFSEYQGQLFHTWHLVTQIIVIMTTTIILIFLKLTAVIVDDSATPVNLSKNYVISKIKNLSVSAELTTDQIENFIAALRYDTPPDSVLKRNENWQRFINEVEDTKFLTGHNLQALSKSLENLNDL